MRRLNVAQAQIKPFFSPFLIAVRRHEIGGSNSRIFAPMVITGKPITIQPTVSRKQKNRVVHLVLLLILYKKCMSNNEEW